MHDRIQSSIVIDIYKEFLNVENLVISSAISESLLKIAKKKEYEYDYESNFHNYIKEYTDQYFRFYCFEKLAESAQGSELIIDQINFEKKKTSLHNIKISNSDYS